MRSRSISHRHEGAGPDRRISIRQRVPRSSGSRGRGAIERAVYLPPATWFDFFTGHHFTGGQTVEADAPIERMPVFVRGGSVVPLGPVKPYADALSDEPTELRVYPGANGSSRSTTIAVTATAIRKANTALCE